MIIVIYILPVHYRTGRLFNEELSKDYYVYILKASMH